MDKQLTAGQALERAADILTLGWETMVEDRRVGRNPSNEDVMAVAAMAQSFSTYALAALAWEGGIDVRTRAGGGI